LVQAPWCFILKGLGSCPAGTERTAVTWSEEDDGTLRYGCICSVARTSTL
jgi:hypothetical protein